MLPRVKGSVRNYHIKKRHDVPLLDVVVQFILSPGSCPYDTHMDRIRRFLHHVVGTWLALVCHVQWSSYHLPSNVFAAAPIPLNRAVEGITRSRRGTFSCPGVAPLGGK